MNAYEQEMRDRLIRVESRMVQLGDYVGANLRSKQRIIITTTALGTAIEIDALDVSLSRIYAELAHRRWENGPPVTPIPVYHNHKLVMTVYTPPMNVVPAPSLIRSNT